MSSSLFIYLFFGFFLKSLNEIKKLLDFYFELLGFNSSCAQVNGTYGGIERVPF